MFERRWRGVHVVCVFVVRVFVVVVVAKSRERKKGGAASQDCRGKRRDEELSKTRFTRRENQDDGVRFRRGRRRRADALPARPGESEGREEPERDPSQSDK